MLLYLELKRWIVTAWQINMQWQTPNSNTVLLPSFFPQIVPAFATGSGSQNQRKDSSCTVVTFVLLLSGLLFLQILKHKHILDGSKTKPAGSCFDSQTHSRELQSPCRSPDSRLHHHIMWNRRFLIARFLEAVCVRTWVKLLFLPQRAELAFLPSRGWCGCEVPNHFWRDIRDLVPGPYSQMTIITVSIRKRVLPSWLQPSAPHELALQW